MKVAYLFLTHRNPQLLKRAMERLSTEHAAFFIHIDRKTDMTQFRDIVGENVIFTDERIPVYWGEFSGVEAILLLLRQAMRSAHRYDYFVLLSGSEYPIRSGKYIHAFLKENRGSEFISMVKVPDEAAGKPLSRINTLRYPSTKPALRLAMKALAKLGMAQRDYRKYLGSLEPYAGNTWWALTRDACEYILAFVSRNERVERYFHNVFAPDESLLHTILGNSAFASRTRRNLVYEDWSARGSRPATISDQDVAIFEAQDKVLVNDIYGSGQALFARKFSDSDLSLLQRIDEMIERKDKQLIPPAQPVAG